MPMFAATALWWMSLASRLMMACLKPAVENRSMCAPTAMTTSACGASR